MRLPKHYDNANVIGTSGRASPVIQKYCESTNFRRFWLLRGHTTALAQHTETTVGMIWI